MTGQDMQMGDSGACISPPLLVCHALQQLHACVVVVNVVRRDDASLPSTSLVCRSPLSSLVRFVLLSFLADLKTLKFKSTFSSSASALNDIE